MKKILILIMFFKVIIIYSQSSLYNHNIKKISFVQKDSIVNAEQYSNSSIEVLNKTFNKLEVIIGGLVNAFSGDSIRQKIIEDVNKDTVLNEEVYKKMYYYEIVNDSIIKRHEETDYTTSPIVINTNKEREYYIYPYPQDEISFIVPFDKIKDLKIQEFKKTKRLIEGFECFKIICSYTEVIEFSKDDDLPELNFPDEYDEIVSEMWVTNEIQSIYHPAFKVKEILNKYYPLEINEESTLRKGSIRSIKIMSIQK